MQILSSIGYGVSPYPITSPSYPSNWIYGDWNVVSFIGLDAFGNSFLFHAQLFIPLGYSPAVPCGFILTAHGSGERSGTSAAGVSSNDANNTGQLGGSTFAAYVSTVKSTFPSIVLAPQTQNVNLGLEYTNGTITPRQKDTYISEVYESAYNAIAPSVNIDTTRIKAIGFSSGGFEVYATLTRYPLRYAFGWVVEGDGSAAEWPYNDTLTASQERQNLVADLAGSPTTIRIDQNSDDGTVSPTGPREIASLLCGAPFTTPFTTPPTTPYSITLGKITYNEFATGGHNSTNAYTLSNVTAMLAVHL